MIPVRTDDMNIYMNVGYDISYQMIPCSDVKPLPLTNVCISKGHADGYIQNENYPNLTTSGECAFEIKKQENTCQFR